MDEREDAAEVVEMVQRKGLVLSPGCGIKAELLFHFHFTKRGRKRTFTERRLCVRSCTLTFCGIEGHEAGSGSMATVPQKIRLREITGVSERGPVGWLCFYLDGVFVCSLGWP